MRDTSEEEARAIGYGLRVDACVCGRLKTLGTKECRICSNRRKGAKGNAVQAQRRARQKETP
jgi:hypothetical protein